MTTSRDEFLCHTVHIFFLRCLTYLHFFVTFYHVDIFTQSPRISLANGFMANRFMKILFLLLCFGRRHMSTLKLSASRLLTTAWHPYSSWLRRWFAKVLSSTIFWRDSCRLCHDPTRWEASFNYWFYVVTLTNILCRTVSLNSSWRSLWITTSRSICWFSFLGFMDWVMFTCSQASSKPNCIGADEGATWEKLRAPYMLRVCARTHSISASSFFVPLFQQICLCFCTHANTPTHVARRKLRR